MIAQLILFVGFYVITYVFGYPISVVFLNEEQKKYDLYLTPWIGLSFLSLLLVTFSRIGFPVNSVAYFLLFLIIVLDVYLFY